MYGFLLLVILGIGFQVLRLTRETGRLRARLEALEAPLSGEGDASRAPDDAPAPAPDHAADRPPEQVAQTPARPTSAWSPPPRRTPADPAEKPAKPRGADWAEALGTWIKANWIYPVAGAALVMASVYLVQYSIDKGLISPAMRIALAVLLGILLMAAGELLRRRWGDGAAGARLVPPTLAGAGVAALFAAVLAAFHLYDMLSAGATLALLAAIALGAMVLGWLHGPFLAAIGIIAASAAPFLLGTGGVPNALIYLYFGAVALLGLGIDGLRRWGWISILAVILPISGAILMAQAGAPRTGLGILALVIAMLALALPGGSLLPTQPWFGLRRPPMAAIAGLLGVAFAAAIPLLLVPAPDSILLSGALAVVLPVWTRRAAGYNRLAMVSAPVLPVAVMASLTTTPLLLSMGLNLHGWLPQAAVGLAVIASLAHFWRSDALQDEARARWAVLGAMIPAATAIAAELFWQPMTLLGFGWPATIMALAAFYTALTAVFARRDAGEGARLGVSLCGAYTMIALALMLMLTGAALSLALAGLLIVAALTDRRFDIPHLGWITGLGAMALGWRLYVDPGVGYLINPLTGDGEVLLTLVAALGGPVAAIVVLRGLAPNRWRDWGRVVMETGLSGMLPVAPLIVIVRFLPELSLHATLGLEACILIALAHVQLQRAGRLQGSRAMRIVRLTLASILGLCALLVLLGVISVFSPMMDGGMFSDEVAGWPVLNDLLLAYAAPAAVLWWLSRSEGGRRRRIARVIALVLAAVWIVGNIRFLWQGGERMAFDHGIAQGELYAYTIALLVAGAAMMALALRYRRRLYRLGGLSLIGIAAAKAFLIDASGLEGLLRAGAFLGLGLSLAGLAWLNSWITERMGADPEQGPEKLE